MAPLTWHPPPLQNRDPGGKGEMGGPETPLGFLDLLIVWFSGAPGGEFRDEPARGGQGDGPGGRPARGSWVRGFAALLRWRRRPFLFFPPLGPLLLGGSPRLLAGSPAQNRGALVEQ